MSRRLKAEKVEYKGRLGNANVPSRDAGCKLREWLLSGTKSLQERGELQGSPKQQPQFPEIKVNSNESPVICPYSPDPEPGPSLRREQRKSHGT